MSDLAAYPKVRIRYQGPPGSHSVAGLATRTKYGRHEYGDVFWVYRADAEADPENYLILEGAEGESQADLLPKTPDELRFPSIFGEQWPSASAQTTATEDTQQASASVEPTAEAPAEITTLDQIGISEELTTSAAHAGLLSVADVVAFVQANGENHLKDIEGIGKKGAKLIVGKLTEHGYLGGQA